MCVGSAPQIVVLGGKDLGGEDETGEEDQRQPVAVHEAIIAKNKKGADLRPRPWMIENALGLTQ